MKAFDNSLYILDLGCAGQGYERNMTKTTPDVWQRVLSVIRLVRFMGVYLSHSFPESRFSIIWQYFVFDRPTVYSKIVYILYTFYF